MPNTPGLTNPARLFAGLTFLAMASCGGLTAEQRAAIAKVQVISVEPAADCQNLGVVSGSRDSDGRGGIRAKAVKLGGNTVRLDVHGGTTAFFCPGPVEERPAVPIVVP